MGTTPQTLAAYIQAARNEQGLSLRELKTLCGVHNSTLARLKEGRIAVPSPDVLIAVIDALGLDLVTTLGLVEPYKRIYTRIVADERKEGRTDE